jgi:hypothetical protein
MSPSKSPGPMNSAVLVGFLLLCFIATAFYGLNFGSHWDENRGKFDSVRESLRTGLLLQSASLEPGGSEYNHGGLNYLLTWAGLTPEVLRFLIKGPRSLNGLSEIVSPVLYSTWVRVRVRAIYVVLSGLSIVWVFALSRLAGRGAMESFIAAALIAFSWEVGYHSRWVAPDALMMQFGWLSFLCLAVGERSMRNLRWFYSGAAAIGLAMGSKYLTVLILPFFLAGVVQLLRRDHQPNSYIAKHTLRLTAAAAGVFILTTPGVVLDPFRFFYQMIYEQREIYATGWYGYTVKPGLPHLLAILKYFALQVFSHYWLISILFSVLCFVGFIALLLERKLITTLAALFTIAYLLFFSAHAVMIVRNLLMVVPFLALATARGITLIATKAGRPAGRIVYATTGILLAVNLGWELYAARQIKQRHHPEYFAKRFADYVQRSPGDTVLISSRLAAALHDASVSVPANVVSDPAAPHNKVAFYQTEAVETRWETWPSNAWGLYDRVFGSMEVNPEAYTTFIGNDRIIEVTKEKFSMLPIQETELITRTAH